MTYYYNEKLWSQGDEYCIAVWLASSLMRKSGKFFPLDEVPGSKMTNYDDVILAFSKWLGEGSG